MNAVANAVSVACLGVVLAWLEPAVSAQEPKKRVRFEGHTDVVQCVAVSPDGKTIASGGWDNTIRFWDVASGKQQAVLKKAAVYGVESVAFSPDGKTLASGIGGSGVVLWDVSTHKQRTLWDRVSEYASPFVVFSSSGKMLASGGMCIQEIRLWNLTTGKHTVTLEGHDVYGIKALAFASDGKTLASVGGHDGLVRFWDVSTGKNVRTLKTVNWTPAAAFSPDAKTLATATYVVKSIDDRNVVADESIKLWDLPSGKERLALKGHASTVSCMIFSPDGKTLAMANDKTIKLWDAGTGRDLATLEGHVDEVRTLAYSNDGKALVSGSKDRTIMLWQVGK